MADASNAGKCLDKYRRLLISRQVGCGKQEGLDRFVVDAGIEVIREHFNGRTGVSQGFGDQPGPEVVIDQENGLRLP